MFSMVTPAVEKEMARLNRRQVVLFGIEAHVCVLQTALDLIDRGYCVWVVVDGVSSRGGAQEGMPRGARRH